MEEKYYKRMAGMLFLIIMLLSTFSLWVVVKYSVLVDQCGEMTYVDLEKPSLEI